MLQLNNHFCLNTKVKGDGGELIMSSIKGIVKMCIKGSRVRGAHRKHRFPGKSPLEERTIK
jgi:hypothetical protein